MSISNSSRTRILTNVGDPLLYPNGEPIANKLVTFSLVTPYGTLTDALDVASQERISGASSVRTDINGEFSIPLWPNDRGNIATKYRFTVNVKDHLEVASTVPSGTIAYTLYEFLLGVNDAPLTPEQTNLLLTHINDDSRHLSPEQLDYLIAEMAPWILVSENFVVAQRGKYLLDTRAGSITATLPKTILSNFTAQFKDPFSSWYDNPPRLEVNPLSRFTILDGTSLELDISNSSIKIVANTTNQLIVI